MTAVFVAVIRGAAVTRQVFRARANGLKLAQDARVCRVRAEQGDAKAEADLGNLYSHGRGVAQDYAEALRWYLKPLIKVPQKPRMAWL